MSLAFILDRSGFMSGLEQDTIGGFSGMLQKQKREEEAHPLYYHNGRNGEACPPTLQLPLCCNLSIWFANTKGFCYS